MGKKFTCTKTDPVVQTKAGKLRGYLLDTTYCFHGIKYANAKRFQMPTEVEPWEGVRNALAYGYVCPLMNQDEPNMEVLIPHRYWPMDENCQYLNIWTQSLDPEAKKPVMVWLHGGGFFSGSSIEHVAYEGDHLSEYGDVVVVSLNHRLNVLGYLDLSPFGEKYQNSGNAGNADMVAALQWIHDNIAGFGGDPDNVTLFGQSGGGMKVYSLMNTPAADGLFHKGIIQSGVIGKAREEKGDGTEIVTAMLKELGLSVSEVEKLETIPYALLAQAYQKAAEGLREKGVYTGNGPMANDWYLGDPRVVGFTDHAKTIPVMVGSCFGEFDFGPVVDGKYHLSREQILAYLGKRFGDQTETLLAEFAKAYPDKYPTDLMCLDYMFRQPSREFIEKKALHPEAPTYSYLFAYEFPFDGGKAAWHCAEIPFVFHNIDRVPICNEPGVTDRLQEKICGAWVHFARYGTPVLPSLPEWPACTPGDEAVMVFDVNCEVRHNFDHRLLGMLEPFQPAFPFEAKEDENGEKPIMLH